MRWHKDPDCVRLYGCPTYARAHLLQLMLRWIDDYLFITSDKGKALSFLDSMSEGKYSEYYVQGLISYRDKGHPDYGCFISTEKTLTNFWCDKHQPNLVAADAQGP